jgi:hypothetical protein
MCNEMRVKHIQVKGIPEPDLTELDSQELTTEPVQIPHAGVGTGFAMRNDGFLDREDCLIQLTLGFTESS